MTDPTHTTSLHVSGTALAASILGFTAVAVGLAMNAEVGFAVTGFEISAIHAGIAVGVFLALCSLLIPALYTASVGFVLAAALVPGGFTAITFAPIGVGLLCILVAPLLDIGHRGPFVVAAVTTLSVLLAAAGGVFLWTSDLPLSAALLLLVFALISYGIHRYEIVRLGFVEGAL